MQGLIAVFAKTPGLSALKTRLAVDIGTVRAEEFYRLSVACVRHTVNEASARLGGGLQPQWTLAEPNGVQSDFWNNMERGGLGGREWIYAWTGAGTLGERLGQVYATAKLAFDYVLLLGTDSPHLTAEAIVQCVTNVQRCSEKVVIGPCTDGGFYILGSQKQIERQVWTDVAYSQSTTCQELILRLARVPIETLRLPEQFDVDEVGDLYRLYQQLRKMQDLSAEQRQLSEWLVGQGFGPDGL